MASVEVDATDLQQLEVRLGRIPAEAVKDARAVVQKGALNIKQDWARRWSGLAHAPSVGKAVTFDPAVSADAIEAEIGPDKGRRQGALGNLLEFGSTNNAPIPGGLPALAAEEPKFAAASERMAADVLERFL